MASHTKHHQPLEVLESDLFFFHFRRLIYVLYADLTSVCSKQEYWFAGVNLSFKMLIRSTALVWGCSVHVMGSTTEGLYDNNASPDGAQ